VPIETCAHCGFDGARWTDQDVVTTVGIVAPLWQGYLEEASPSVVSVRPYPHRWSVAEYSQHLVETIATVEQLLVTAFAEPGTDVGALPRPAFALEPAVIDLEATLAAMAAGALQTQGQLQSHPDETWSQATVRVRGSLVDAGWLGRHLVHETMHHLHDVGRVRVALGDGVARQHGSVVQLNVSGGGVPKHPVDQFDIGWSGAAQDVQGDRRHHGRPFQALSLWSTEVIAALQAEGHPIEAGLAGENITVSGLDWPSLRPGTMVRIGTARAEISSHATPCAKNAGWFADGQFRRIDHDDHPGWSRLYATVLSPGHVGLGDGIEIEPPA
jgi:MOSC domain-containing protein YiiM